MAEPRNPSVAAAPGNALRRAEAESPAAGSPASRPLAVLLTLWLPASIVSSLWADGALPGLSEPSEVAASLVQGALHVAFLAAVLLASPVRDGGPSGALAAVSLPRYGILAVVLLLSAVDGSDPMRSLPRIGALIVCALTLSAFASHLDLAALGRALGRAALVSLAVLAACAALEWRTWPGGRWTAGSMIPNRLGALAAVVAGLALCVQNRPLRVGGAAAGAVMVALTGSRAAMVAVAVTLGFYGFVRLGRRRGGWGLVAIGAVASLVAVAVLLWPHAILEWTDENLLLVSDEYRGIYTMGGRTAGWQEGIELFLAHPLLGVGLTNSHHAIVAGSGIHSAYITALAELGILGTLACAWLVLDAAAQSRRLLTSHTGLVLTSVAAGLLVRGVVENDLVGGLTATTLVFLLWVILMPFHARRREAALRLTALDFEGRWQDARTAHP